MLTKEEEWIAKFWFRVDICGPNECWEWTAGKQSRGYGCLWVAGKRKLAHRVAWELVNGAIPEGTIIRHRVCNNPPCCNPVHLASGTHWDNVQDALRAGRFWTQTCPERRSRGDQHYSRTNPERLAHGERNGKYTHPERTPRGERHGMSKLTNQQVAEIRCRYKQGGVSQRMLAAEYGVSRRAVVFILQYKTWKHLDKQEG